MLHLNYWISETLHPKQSPTVSFPLERRNMIRFPSTQQDSKISINSLQEPDSYSLFNRYWHQKALQKKLRLPKVNTCWLNVAVYMTGNILFLKSTKYFANNFSKFKHILKTNVNAAYILVLAMYIFDNYYTKYKYIPGQIIKMKSQCKSLPNLLFYNFSFIWLYFYN